jgi:predicted RNase H-like nuclease (RuvC/YqgF family)
MAKQKDDPQALQTLVKERDAHIRELNDQVKNLPRERKQFQQAKDEAAAATAAADQAKAELRAARKEIAVLEQALDSERSARASERKKLEAATDLARALKALS